MQTDAESKGRRGLLCGQAASLPQSDGISGSPSSGMAMSWLSMKGRLRSHSGGGRGPHPGLLRSRTPAPTEAATLKQHRHCACWHKLLDCSNVRCQPADNVHNICSICCPGQTALKCRHATRQHDACSKWSDGRAHLYTEWLALHWCRQHHSPKSSHPHRGRLHRTHVAYSEKSWHWLRLKLPRRQVPLLIACRLPAGLTRPWQNFLLRCCS